MRISRRSGATRLQALLCIVGLACLLGGATALGQTTDTWTGGAGDGKWSSTANWDLGIVPLNLGMTTYGVVIPQNAGNILFDAPVTPEQVTDFSLAAGSTLTIPGGRNLTVLQDFSNTGTIQGSGGLSLFSVPGPGIVSLDYGQYYASGGATLSFPAATSYRCDWQSIPNRTALSADGTGSLVDLSHVTSFNGAAWGANGGYTYSVQATNNGVIDLSRLTSVTGAANGCWLKFSAASGGTINLGSLTQTSGGVWFDVGTEMNLTLPAAQMINGGQITVPAGATFNAPNLASLDYTTVAVSGGGVFSAGAALTSYRCDWQSIPNRTALSADGTGSLVDLSHVTSFNGAAWGANGGYTYSVQATNNGVIDLSRLTSVTGAANGCWLKFSAASGGTINLASLHSVSGRTQFTVGTGGRIILGEVVATDTTSINVTDPTGNLEFTTLSLGNNSSLTAAPGAKVTMRGSLIYTHSDASLVSMDRSELDVLGGATHLLEAASLDEGLGGSTSGNFGLGRLVLGDLSGPATLSLVDLIDNGNRAGGMHESLYLYGMGGMDGLLLNNGSQLNLDGLNVYSWQQGQWVFLNSLFPAGVISIPYSNGTLTVPEPSTLALLAAGALGLLACAWRRRRAA